MFLNTPGFSRLPSSSSFSVWWSLHFLSPGVLCEKGPFLSHTTLYLLSLPLLCHLHQDSNLFECCRNLLELFHSLIIVILFYLALYHLESKVSSRYFRGEHINTHLDTVGCPRSKNFSQGSALGSELKSPISQTFWVSHQQPPYQRHIILDIIYGLFIFIEENKTI